MTMALMHHLQLWRHRKNWRRLNPHNRTVAGTLFDPGKVSVGNLTYGGLNVTEGCYPNERLDIGHCCCISRGVQFLLAGQHFTNRPTMFPVRGLATGKRGGDGYSRGPIVVGSDVWIGIGAMILSGVTIGQGAVVGAGSVVARDVPPYAVVAGNRAEIVKYRFPEDVVAELLKLDFARLTREQCLRHLEILSRPLNLDDLRWMISELERDS